MIDYAKAAHYFQLAANEGLARAQLHYGQCLLGYRRIGPDTARAIRYLRSSADNGEAISQLLFTFLLENGIGILPDVRLAVKYYNLASRSFPSACVFYGWRLRIERGVPVNFTEAAGQFQRAADSDNVNGTSTFGFVLKSVKDLRKT
jgi:TPR repeat protein